MSAELFQVVWANRGGGSPVVLGIFGTPAPSVVFVSPAGEPIPGDELRILPFCPFGSSVSNAALEMLSLVEMELENAEHEGREPNPALLLAFAVLSGKSPAGPAEDLRAAIRDLWCDRFDRGVFKVDAGRGEP